MERDIIDQQAEIDITGLSHRGEGVGRYRGIVVFIPGALPGEKVLSTIVDVKKNLIRGQLEKVIKPAPTRVTPRCDVYHACGGCQLQHLDYVEQLWQKTVRVEETLKRLGNLDGVTVHAALGMDNPWAYRNKAVLQVGIDEQGKVILGYFDTGTHNLAPANNCLLLSQKSREILSETQRLLQELLAGQTITKRQVSLKQVLIKEAMETGEVMLGFIVTPGFHPAQQMADELVQAFPHLTSVLEIRERKKHAPVVRVLRGRETISEKIGPFIFQISALSFFQVNPYQTERLYNKAVEYAALTGKETVLDVYCGTGSISLFLARKAAFVYGIEEVKEAIEDAVANAEENKVKNVQFMAAPAEDMLPRLASRGLRPDVVVLDPPRKGCHPRVLETIAQVGPRRIVYVSCNPATLARDLKTLGEKGYRTLEVQPVDMFPQTAHIECVVSLKRQHMP